MPEKGASVRCQALLRQASPWSILGTRRPCRSRRPRVNKHQAAPREVPDIAGRESRFAHVDDTGNLDIANLDRPAGAAAPRINTASGLGRSLVEGQNAAFKILLK